MLFLFLMNWERCSLLPLNHYHSCHQAWVKYYLLMQDTIFKQISGYSIMWNQKLKWMSVSLCFASITWTVGLIFNYQVFVLFIYFFSLLKWQWWLPRCFLPSPLYKLFLVLLLFSIPVFWHLLAAFQPLGTSCPGQQKFAPEVLRPPHLCEKGQVTLRTWDWGGDPFKFRA